MRRLLLALMAVFVMTAQLSLPLVLALGVDPCANEGDHRAFGDSCRDHACPPLGDDCHDCARCSPQPAVLATPPAVVLDIVPISSERPALDAAAPPAEAPREPPSRVPRALA